jgi:hypothetical protein
VVFSLHLTWFSSVTPRSVPLTDEIIYEMKLEFYFSTEGLGVSGRHESVM